MLRRPTLAVSGVWASLGPAGRRHKRPARRPPRNQPVCRGVASAWAPAAVRPVSPLRPPRGQRASHHAHNLHYRNQTDEPYPDSHNMSMPETRELQRAPRHKRRRGRWQAAAVLVHEVLEVHEGQSRQDGLASNQQNPLAGQARSRPQHDGRHLPGAIEVQRPSRRRSERACQGARPSWGACPSGCGQAGGPHQLQCPGGPGKVLPTLSPRFPCSAHR